MSLDPTQDAIDHRPLPAAYVHIPVAIATWIDNVAPCVADGTPQSQQVTDMIVVHLRQRGVSDADIADALSKSQYVFSYGSSVTFNLAVRLKKYTPPQ